MKGVVALNIHKILLVLIFISMSFFCISCFNDDDDASGNDDTLVDDDGQDSDDDVTDDDVDDDANDDIDDDSDDDVNDDTDDDSDDDVNDDVNDDIDDDVDDDVDDDIDDDVDDDVDDDTFDCTFDEDCDDGLFCNGQERCIVHVCYDGVEPCDNGIWCDGLEGCDEVNAQCLPSSGNPCPDDGQWCNGNEQCDEANNQCLHSHTPEQRCPDNDLYCDGAEVCDEDSDSCYSAGNPCAPDFPCNEDLGACETELAHQYIIGGRVADDGTSMEMGPDGSLYIATTRLRDVVLFTLLAGGDEWNEEFVAENGEEAEIAVDQDGNVHIVFIDIAGEKLKYATNLSGLWEVEIIVSHDFIRYPHVDVENDGTVHILYSEMEMHHVTDESSEWISESIGSGDGPFSVDLDEEGYLHITYESYSRSHSEIYYATNTGDSWEHFRLHSGYMGHRAFVTAADDGTAHVLMGTIDEYWTDDDDYWGDDDHVRHEVSSLDYLSGTGGDFTTENVEYNENTWIYYINVPLGTDSQGYVHACYPWKDLWDDPLSLHYATNMSSAWESVEISPFNVLNTSLVADPQSHVHLSHSQNSSCDLGYLSNVTGEWIDQVIGVGSFSVADVAMTVDRDGHTHIAYYEVKNRDLAYSTDKSGAWVTSIIDAEGDVGLYPDIIVDEQGHLFISYYDVGNKHLKMASNIIGWETETVDSSQMVGRYNSIALGTDGSLYISYFNESNDQPKLATSDGSFWSYEIIDDDWFYKSGWYTSLASDHQDALHVAYCRTDNFYFASCDELVYATNQSGGWERTVVDSMEDSGYKASLAVDPTGKVHIAYESKVWDEDYYAKAIKYAAKDVDQWSMEVVQKLPNNFSSLFVDADGVAHMAYTYEYKVHYAHRTDVGWAKYNISDPADHSYNMKPSLGVDAERNIHVAYLSDQALWFTEFPVPNSQ